MNPNKILLYSSVSALSSHYHGIFLLQHMGKSTMTHSQTLHIHTMHTHTHTLGGGQGDRDILEHTTLNAISPSYASTMSRNNYK